MNRWKFHVPSRQHNRTMKKTRLPQHTGRCEGITNFNPTRRTSRRSQHLRSSAGYAETPTQPNNQQASQILHSLYQKHQRPPSSPPTIFFHCIQPPIVHRTTANSQQPPHNNPPSHPIQPPCNQHSNRNEPTNKQTSITRGHRTKKKKEKETQKRGVSAIKSIRFRKCKAIARGLCEITKKERSRVRHLCHAAKLCG